METVKLRLAGSGGQGLILAGIIMAEAAINSGKNAVQTQSYGPEARGGASKAEVIISDNEILFPKIEVPNVLLSLTQVSFDKYHGDIDKEGIIIVDEAIELPDSLDVKTIIKAPILRTATEEIGKSIVANIVAVAMLAEITKSVGREYINEAVLQRVPKGSEELNMRALEAGYKLGEKYV